MTLRRGTRGDALRLALPEIRPGGEGTVLMDDNFLPIKLIS